MTQFKCHANPLAGHASFHAALDFHPFLDGGARHLPPVSKRKLNSAAAKSAERRSLLEQLRVNINKLHAFVAFPYQGESALDSWPTESALNGLYTAVVKTAQSVGIKKTDLIDFDKAMHRIDRRYPNPAEPEPKGR